MASLLSKVMSAVLFMLVLLCYVIIHVQIMWFWSMALQCEKLEIHLRAVTRIKQKSSFVPMIYSLYYV